MIEPKNTPGRQSRAPRQQQLVPAPRRYSWSAAIQLVALLFGFLAVSPGVYAETTPAAAEQTWLVNTEASVIAGEPLAARTGLLDFYTRRQNRPAWLARATLTADAVQLLDVLRSVDKEGLDPRDYHLPMMTSGQLTANQLELLLTDAALRYAHDQLVGRYDPRRMDPQWFIMPPAAPDSVGALQAALEKHQVAQWLAALPPPHPDYARLRKALAHYRELAAQAPWPTLEAGPKLSPGEHDARVPALRQRLESSAELAHTETVDAMLYDDTLAKAVRRFQSTRGLEPDGIVGKATRDALNVSPQQRVRQLRSTMERWRWLPRQFGARHVRVNVASFELQVEENDKPVLSMNVIVGKEQLSTPAFRSQLTHVVFNPSWTIPYSIASKEILPKLKTNPGYLAEENIQVFDSAGGEPLDPALIDWSQYTEKNFPYRLRQLPGPLNSLGQIKFLLPNSYAIYLHDTPNRRLFNKSVRALSHGCIRIQQPDALAEYLLGDHTKWNPESITATIAQQQTRTVTLPQPIPIYLLYFTAWVDAEGVVQFRDDIYTRDVKLAQAFGSVN